MNKKVIDVSSYQGDIDWKRVKESGIQGAILKAIRKDLNPDKHFENNWKGCEKVALPIIGVYNYSYAVTLDKAKLDARKVITILSGRKVKVWLDIEDACLKGKGVFLLEIIKAYQNEIELAGLDFGVYTGLSFYNSNLKPYINQPFCNFWIARYPYGTRMDVSKNPPSKKKPVISQLEGWQYSSKGQVSGIQGNVDMNLWYDIFQKETLEFSENIYPIPVRILRLKRPLVYGNDVKWIQYHLIRLGFLPAQRKCGKSNIDGIFGNDTDRAIRAVQKHFGIAVDGIAGPVTVDVLQNY